MIDSDIKKIMRICERMPESEDKTEILRLGGRIFQDFCQDCEKRRRALIEIYDILNAITARVNAKWLGKSANAILVNLRKI